MRVRSFCSSDVMAATAHFSHDVQELMVSLLIEPFGDADDRLVADSVAGVLNDALGGLSKRDRETLLLFALEGLTYAEISVALDIPIGTVGSRITRARQQINESIPGLQQMITSMRQPDDQEGSGD